MSVSEATHSAKRFLYQEPTSRLWSVIASLPLIAGSYLIARALRSLSSSELLAGLTFFVCLGLLTIVGTLLFAGRLEVSRRGMVLRYGVGRGKRTFVTWQDIADMGYANGIVTVQLSGGGKLRIQNAAFWQPGATQKLFSEISKTREASLFG